MNTLGGASLHHDFIAGLDGDKKRYRAFLDALASGLREFLQRHGDASFAETERVLQDGLLAVHRARHTYHLDQPLTGWIHAVIAYTIKCAATAGVNREALLRHLNDDHLFLGSAPRASVDE
jgi:RNA polymerase sigma-70 factor (ECF subfamily)